ncbi:MAG: DUF1653 domain-containing protein [Congregibacter sp.]
MEIEAGLYRHYKGGEYEVLGAARHSETEEWMVLYRPLYLKPGNTERSLWVRPLTMFVEIVTVDGQQLRRFEFVAALTDPGSALD